MQNSTEKIVIDDNLRIEVASLEGIFILKLFSWIDLHIENNKDADDIAFIINNYLNINEERAINEHYEEIYLSDDFSSNIAGAKLLGIDATRILSNNLEARQKIVDILKMEISKAEESKLINQILETHRNFNFAETVACLQALHNGIKLD